MRNCNIHLLRAWLPEKHASVLYALQVAWYPLAVPSFPFMQSFFYTSGGGLPWIAVLLPGEALQNP